MIEIKKIPPSEWSALLPIFDKVFEVDLPNPRHTEIIGAYEDGKLQGFILLETAVFIGEFWSRSKENNGLVARKLVSFAKKYLPDKQGIGAVAQQPRFEMLFKTLGMGEVPGKIFWRNPK